MPETVWGDARVMIPDRSDMYTELYHDRIENGANLFVYPEYFDAAAGFEFQHFGHGTVRHTSHEWKASLSR